MVKLGMYSILIVITFFCVGAFSGKLFVKFPDREQREEKLMWIFLTFLMMYFGSGFCIQMITGHKGFTLLRLQDCFYVRLLYSHWRFRQRAF